MSNFKITAHTVDPKVYFVSVIDSGYSIDNIAPEAPAGVIVSVTQSISIVLSWNDPIDEDFAFFRIYRSVESGFDPSSMEPINELSEPFFTDAKLPVDNNFYYRISAVDANGNESDFSEEVSATVLSILDGVFVPDQYALHQNFPNPFNPTTTIQFDLPIASEVRLVVYDVLGREVTRLADGDMTEGYHQLVWNGKGTDGRTIPTGIYIARLTTPGYTKSIKMVLLK